MFVSGIHACSRNVLTCFNKPGPTTRTKTNAKDRNEKETKDDVTIIVRTIWNVELPRSIFQNQLRRQIYYNQYMYIKDQCKISTINYKI